MKSSTHRALLCLALLVTLGLALWWQPLAGLAIALALVFGFLLWWLSLRPSNEGDWSPEYAETPWAEIDGDEVTIHNFRHCAYRSATEVIPHWETKTLHLAQLRGLDLLINDFGARHIAHTFFSFDFGPEGCACTSIEARRQRHETYSPLRGLFRQYELYYAIGDERDLIRLRTEHRHQGVYLYRLAGTDLERLRVLFLAYLRAANELREHPRWYHAAFDNCTTNMRVNARASGFAFRWTWQILINGHLDEFLHRRGFISSSLPFTETKARARVNQRAHEADNAPDFSQRIRAPLPNG